MAVRIGLALSDRRGPHRRQLEIDAFYHFYGFGLTGVRSFEVSGAGKGESYCQSEAGEAGFMCVPGQTKDPQTTLVQTLGEPHPLASGGSQGSRG